MSRPPAPAGCLQRRLDEAEASLELGVGIAGRRFDIHVQFPTQVRANKDQIANLLGDFIGISGRYRLPHLGELLVDLFQDPPGIRPVEADPCGAFLQLLGALESG